MRSSTEATAGDRQKRLEQMLRASPIIPVVTIERAEDAVPLARALLAGGLTAIEITLRTPVAAAAAAAIVTGIADVTVGVGTVLNSADLARANDIGARFALSPGASAALLEAAKATDLPFVPGIATATEAMAAMTAGFDIVKFFPAVPAGGLPALKALAGPFPELRFCPTGGISEANFADWLAEPNVLAVGGSWLVPLADIRKGDWSTITERARRAVARIEHTR